MDNWYFETTGYMKYYGMENGYPFWVQDFRRL